MKLNLADCLIPYFIYLGLIQQGNIYIKLEQRYKILYVLIFFLLRNSCIFVVSIEGKNKKKIYKNQE